MTTTGGGGGEVESARRSGVRLATGVGAGSLLLVVIVAGVLLTVRGHHGSGDGTVAGTAPTVVTAPPAASGSAGRPDGGVKALATAPTTRWELYQGAAVPYSATYGPRTIDGYGPATGYTHDAGGALFAVAQLNARIPLSPKADARKVLDTQVVKGAGWDVAAAAIAKRTITAGTVPYSINQIAAYRLVAYSPTVTSIELVVRSQTGALAASTTTLEWAGGDWKLQLTATGDTGTSPVPVTSLTGYVPWSGV